MDTVEQAIDYLRHNNTPYWWVKSGNSKIADNTDEADINASVELFRKSAVFFPAGSYKLECSRNPKDRSGSYLFPFTKGTNAQPANSMQPVQSTNAYGVSDVVLKQIQEETRRTLLFEQMADKFGPAMELLKDLDTRLKKVEKFLSEDEDEDGIPDFAEMTKKASDTVQAAHSIKKVFEGGKLFG